MSGTLRQRWEAEYMADPVELRLKHARLVVGRAEERVERLTREANSGLDSAWLARRQLKEAIAEREAWAKQVETFEEELRDDGASAVIPRPE